MNVTGTWHSDNEGWRGWSPFHLRQASGSREVSGLADPYKITGVVSRGLFMLLSTDEYVEYCIVLSSEGDGLSGNYFSRRSRRQKQGCCDEESGSPFYLAREK